MAIINVGDLFHKAEEFEQMLEKYYVQIRDETEDNGVRLLTYYLSRHRNHLGQVLADFSTNDTQKVRNIKLKYDVAFLPEKEFHLFEADPKAITGKELLEAAAASTTRS